MKHLEKKNIRKIAWSVNYNCFQLRRVHLKKNKKGWVNSKKKKSNYLILFPGEGRGAINCLCMVYRYNFKSFFFLYINNKSI